MFAANKVDINFVDSAICNMPSATSNYVFTNSYMTIGEYVYSRVDDSRVEKLADLHGKKLGMVLGYYYPLLEEALMSGKIVKVDTVSEASGLAMLRLRRIDFAISDSTHFAYLGKKGDISPADFKQGMQLSKAALGIKLRKEIKAYLGEFNGELRAMKEDGTIARIIQRYHQ